MSKKELNSNHDGADETSGKQGVVVVVVGGGEWRPPVHRHFHVLLLSSFALPRCCVGRYYACIISGRFVAERNGRRQRRLADPG